MWRLGWWWLFQVARWALYQTGQTVNPATHAIALWEINSGLYKTTKQAMPQRRRRRGGGGGGGHRQSLFAQHRMRCSGPILTRLARRASTMPSLACTTRSTVASTMHTAPHDRNPSPMHLISLPPAVGGADEHAYITARAAAAAGSSSGPDTALAPPVKGLGQYCMGIYITTTSVSGRSQATDGGHARGQRVKRH